MPRPVNDAGLDLVRTFEGLRTEAYRCPAGVWTIGYGHTGDVRPVSASAAQNFSARGLGEYCDWPLPGSGLPAAR